MQEFKQGKYSRAGTALLAEERSDGGWAQIPMKRFVFAPTKLVAAVGPFDVLDAGHAGRNRVPVRIVVPKGKGNQAEYAEFNAVPLRRVLVAKLPSQSAEHAGGHAWR